MSKQKRNSDDATPQRRGGRPRRNDPDVSQVSSKMCAEILGMSRPFFLKCVRLNYIPPSNGKDKYDLKAVVQAWGKHLEFGRKPAQVFDAKRALLEEKHRQAKLENDTRERKLVKIDEVEDAFVEAMTIIAMRLDSLAGRMANELAGISDPAVIRQRLRNEIIGIREAASQGLSNFVGHPTRRRRTEASADSDPGSVGGREENPPSRKRRARPVSE